MNNQILKIISSMAFLLIVACDPVEGDLIVKESFTVKKTLEPCHADSLSCMSQGEEEVELTSGNYDMQLDVDSTKALFLQVSKKWTLIRMELKLPNNKIIPSNGELKLNSQESGQPFDFSMKSQTTVHESSLESGNETCSERVQTEVCYVVPGNPPTKRCELKWVTAKGLQYVEFYYRTTYQQVESLFMKKNSEEVLAVYKGARSNSDKIYTRRDRCELYRPYVYDN